MVCFSPLPAFRSDFSTKSGKCRTRVLRRTEANLHKYSMRVPCSQCSGCRLEYSRQWAIRCMHEASLYEDNAFITLTYNDKFLPDFGSLNYTHWTNFMKRLRFKFASGIFVNVGDSRIEYVSDRIRFYMGPEYGEKSGRPHYHALLFNCDFPDKELFNIRNGHRLYTSNILDSLWTCPTSGESYGFASVGNVTFESAAYVARYMMKKVKGDDLLMRYFSKVIDFSTGEIHPIAGERARMSRRPGIAKDWFDLYFNSDVLPGDFCILNGKKVRPPKYYDVLYERIDPVNFEDIKMQRVIDAAVYAPNNTEDRLRVRSIVKDAQLNRLVRNIDL